LVLHPNYLGVGVANQGVARSNFSLDGSQELGDVGVIAKSRFKLPNERAECAFCRSFGRLVFILDYFDFWGLGFGLSGLALFRRKVCVSRKRSRVLCDTLCLIVPTPLKAGQTRSKRKRIVYKTFANEFSLTSSSLERRTMR
jgi:hypothetical protein